MVSLLIQACSCRKSVWLSESTNVWNIEVLALKRLAFRQQFLLPFACRLIVFRGSFERSLSRFSCGVFLIPSMRRSGSRYPSTTD